MIDTNIYLGQIWDTSVNSGQTQLNINKDGGLVVKNGKICFRGTASETKQKYPDAIVHDFSHNLIIPGFVDTHSHMPQLDMIGCHSHELLHWLETYTFPTEAKFENDIISQNTSLRFLEQLAENGVSQSLVFSTVHERATNIFFQQAAQTKLKLIIGKVSMDQNAPSNLIQNADEDYFSCKKLIKKWHNFDERLHFAITPRFAPTSTTALLESMKTLKKEHPDVWLQTHFSETKDEISFVKKVFPKSKDYLDVYETYDLLGSKTILAHCIHMSESEQQRVLESSTSIAHCPSSNLFLGSGLMSLSDYMKSGFKLSLGSDIGAGTSMSPWQTMSDAYKVQSLIGAPVSPISLFYLSTLGGAEALSLDSTTGNFSVGKDADFQVLNPTKISALKNRFSTASDCSEENQLLALIMGADSRILQSLYVKGQVAYQNQILRLN
jgi:guanine deaminase